MNSEELSLTWDDHHSTIVGVFVKLLESNTLVDCTIAAEGQYLRAHKVVLSACSPYFEMLFTQENEKNPIVVLKDIKFQEVKSMIDFVYRGKVKIPEDRLGDFVAAAESLQIKGLGGNHSQNNSKQKEVPPQTRKREIRASPTPGKRFRSHTSSNATEKTSVCATPAIDLSNDTNSCESILKHEESLDIPTSLPSQPSSSKTAPSAPVCVVSAQETTTKFEPIPSTSYIQPVQPSLPLLPEQTLLPLMDSGTLDQGPESIVKSEPEPIAQVFLTETDCLVEPKTEVCDEVSLLESSEETAEQISNDVSSQQSTSHYPGFQSSIETGDMRTSDSFMVPLVGPSIAQGLEGVALSARSRGRGGRRGRGASNAPVKKGYVFGSGSRHQCPVCLKIFNKAYGLRRHLRLHTGERPFQCPECLKSFAQNVQLRSHSLIHTGEQPYACEPCNEKWRCRSTYMRHMARVHNEFPDAPRRRRRRGTKMWGQRDAALC